MSSALDYTYVPASAASAASVTPGFSVHAFDGERSTSSGSAASAMSSMQSAIDRIMQLSEQNSARSEAAAREQRDWAAQQQDISQKFNAAEAAKNRDWQQMMSSTAHQREVEDLRAAGLNPVLSASGGQGAATTSGATASSNAASGSKADIDMSSTMALVSLLGTMWSAQTQLEMQRANAQNNLAIADKQAAASQAVAQIYGEYGLRETQLAGQFGLDQAEVHGLYSKLVAEIQSGATISSAQIHAAATKYAADQGLAGTQLQSFTNQFTSLVRAATDFDIADLTSQRSADTALAVAQQNAASSLASTTERNYSSPYGFFKNVLSGDLFNMRSSGKSSSFGGSRKSGFGK